MVDTNVLLAQRVVEEGFGANNPGIFDELASEDFVEHQRGMSEGKEAPKRAILSLHGAFPDIKYKLINTIAQDDLVCLHYNVTGTHTGKLGPLPASGKKFSINLIDIMRFRDGKLVEHWGVPDQLGLMTDLGFWPPK